MKYFNFTVSFLVFVFVAWNLWDTLVWYREMYERNPVGYKNDLSHRVALWLTRWKKQ